MKLLADRLMLSRPKGDVEGWALTTLKTPGTNHAPAAGPVALCDRFVFDQVALKALRGSTFDFGDDAARVTPTPAECAWIDVTASHGWLVSGDTAYAIFDFGRAWGIRHAATVPLVGDVNNDIFVRFSDFVQTTFDRRDEVDTKLRAYLGRAAGLVHKFLMALASPRAATSRRVLPGAGLDRGQKAFALRRAQRGVPVFSYNKVDMIRPGAAMHNGVLRSVESAAGTRLHMVIGHWRLIDGVVEPYWIWVDGHQRGDAELGTIVKERHVRLDTGGMRRGFRLPEQVGHKGQRTRAVRA
ncbi:hypothetical protein [Ancylobacter mangrovi]|uniref:hypothetical protein n=1 Tax=Ancylobacter mangrovi TaxID=2972472 RepID=UPI0021630F75|nr:hypothetical protein [Ancylobacter mangrovi]MCS0501402.1 hypothetical protein [Ancylobacter mangrovi]